MARAGLTATTRPSGEEALACLETEQFDAVVSDVIMPRMSGFELLQDIRLSRPWLPVILMSSLEQDIREVAMAAGAVALFDKPVDGAALVAAIGKANCNHGPLSSREDVALAVLEGR